MKAELTGKKFLPITRFTVKRLSGRAERGRERFVVGSWRRAGVRVTMFDCTEEVGFERILRGSDRGRTAAAAIAAAVIVFCNMNLIVTS